MNQEDERAIKKIILMMILSLISLLGSTLQRIAVYLRNKVFNRTEEKKEE